MWFPLDVELSRNSDCPIQIRREVPVSHSNIPARFHDHEFGWVAVSKDQMSSDREAFVSKVMSFCVPKQIFGWTQQKFRFFFGQNLSTLDTDIVVAKTESFPWMCFQPSLLAFVMKICVSNFTEKNLRIWRAGIFLFRRLISSYDRDWHVIHIEWFVLGRTGSGLIHTGRATRRTHKLKFFLWSCLRAVWTHPLMTTGPICFASHHASCVN